MHLVVIEGYRMLEKFSPKPLKMTNFEVRVKMKVVDKEVSNPIQLKSLNLNVLRRRYEFLKREPFCGRKKPQFIAAT